MTRLKVYVSVTTEAHLRAHEERQSAKPIAPALRSMRFLYLSPAKQTVAQLRDAVASQYAEFVGREMPSLRLLESHFAEVPDNYAVSDVLEPGAEIYALVPEQIGTGTTAGRKRKTEPSQQTKKVQLIEGPQGKDTDAPKTVAAELTSTPATPGARSTPQLDTPRRTKAEKSRENRLRKRLRKQQSRTSEFNLYGPNRVDPNRERQSSSGEIALQQPTPEMESPQDAKVSRGMAGMLHGGLAGAQPRRPLADRMPERATVETQKTAPPKPSKQSKSNTTSSKLPNSGQELEAAPEPAREARSKSDPSTEPAQKPAGTTGSEAEEEEGEEKEQKSMESDVGDSESTASRYVAPQPKSRAIVEAESESVARELPQPEVERIEEIDNSTSESGSSDASPSRRPRRAVPAPDPSTSVSFKPRRATKTLSQPLPEPTAIMEESIPPVPQSQPVPGRVPGLGSLSQLTELAVPEVHERLRPRMPAATSRAVEESEESEESSTSADSDSDSDPDSDSANRSARARRRRRGGALRALR